MAVSSWSSSLMAGDRHGQGLGLASIPQHLFSAATMQAGQCISTAGVPAQHVYRMVVLSNGLVVSGSWGGSIHCWRVDEREEKWSCLSEWKTPQENKGHQSDVIALRVLSGNRVLSGGREGKIRCWDVDENTGEAKYLGSWQGYSQVTALVVLSESRVISGGGDGTIQVWQVNDAGKAVCINMVKEAHSGWISALELLPNGWVVSAGFDGTVRSWQFDDAGKASCGGKQKQHYNWVLSLAVLPNGLFMSGSRDQTINCWQMDEKGNFVCLDTWEDNVGNVEALLVLPNKWVLSGSDRCKIQCWHVDEMTGSAQCLATWKGHKGQVSTLALLPDGRVVSGSTDRTVRCWQGLGALVKIQKTMWGLWELSSTEYESYVQWPPREMIEDIIALL